jgi:hypothetical protein
MPQALPSNRELLHANRQLPEGVQQSMVMIRFAKPVFKSHALEFMRIHLTAAMLSGGEGDFYQAELFAKERMLKQECPRCRRPERPLSTWLWVCVNPQCSRFQAKHDVKPPRGVVQVLIPSDAISVRDGIEHMDKCVLVLDRRYRQNVLAAVYRTAGNLADEIGVKIR